MSTSSRSTKRLEQQVGDVATGERVHVDAELEPTRYHRGARAVITRTSGGVRLRRLIGGDARVSVSSELA